MTQIVPLPQSLRNSAITFNKKFTPWSNRFKTIVPKKLLKTLGT